MSTTKESKKTYKKAMLEIRDQYRDAGQPWPPQARDIAAWAIEELLWEPPPELALRKCTRDMADAMKEERHCDPQGRFVKTNVAARLEFTDEEGQKKQGYFWDDLRTASEDHLLRSFDQQRDGVAADVKSLSLQIQSANDNNPALQDRPIELLWDFTEDANLDESPDPKKPR